MLRGITRPRCPKYGEGHPNRRAQAGATDPSSKYHRGAQQPVARAPGSENRRVMVHGRSDCCFCVPPFDLRKGEKA
jgi:hypothetical protein